MGKFAVVRERSSHSLEKLGLFQVEGETVVIYRDGDEGAFGILNLSGRGKGVKMVIKMRVLKGKEKKRAVFKVKKEYVITNHERFIPCCICDIS